MPLTFKTTLCDDHCHMTAEEFCQHKIKEKDYLQRKALEKLANNPILTTEMQNVMLKAIYDLDMKNWWFDRYMQMKDRYEAIRNK